VCILLVEEDIVDLDGKEVDIVVLKPLMQKK
jgi:hypothetical protein